jgi:hypothetical protein
MALPYAAPVGKGEGEFVENVLFVKHSKLAHTYTVSLPMLPQNFVVRYWMLIKATCLKQLSVCVWGVGFQFIRPFVYGVYLSGGGEVFTERRRVLKWLR